MLCRPCSVNDRSEHPQSLGCSDAVTKVPEDQESRVFRLTLEDLRDDAFRKKTPLERTAVDALYLKRGISPEEAIAIERALKNVGVTILDESDDFDCDDFGEESQDTGNDTPKTALENLLRTARGQPLLTPDEEKRLGHAIQRALSLDVSADGEFIDRIRENAQKARDKLITRNVRLVVKVAFDARNRNRLDVDDLVQMGLIGLMRAAEKFDPTWETRFSTYAMWWIRQAIGRGIDDQATTIRIPVHMRHAIYRYRRKARDIDRASGDQIAAIAESLGWTEEYTAKVATFAEQRTISMDAPMGKEEEFTLQDVLADEMQAPDSTLIEKDTTEQVRELVEGLGDERLSAIVSRRFGLYGEEETLQQIASDYDVTRERIRQLEGKALRILKKKRIARRLARALWNRNI